MVSFDTHIKRQRGAESELRSVTKYLGNHQPQRPRDEGIAAQLVPALHGAEPDTQRAGLIGAGAERGQEGGEGVDADISSFEQEGK